MLNKQNSIFYVQEAPPNSVQNTDQVESEIHKEVYQKDKETIVVGNNVSYWGICHVITILGLCAVSLAPQMFIPRQNLIYYPNNLNEMIILITAICVATIAMRIFDSSFFTKEKSILKISVMLKMYLCLVVPGLVCFYSSAYCWSSIIGNQLPMPFTGILVFFSGWFIFICCLWLGIMFPKELRLNKDFRCKIRRYVKYEIWFFVIYLQKDILSFGFKAISGYYQSLFALIIPLVKEMNKRILQKIILKSVGKDDDGMMNIRLSTRLNIQFAFFVAI